MHSDFKDERAKSAKGSSTRLSSEPAFSERMMCTTFGVSREAFNKVVSSKGCNYECHDPKLPGPGYY